MQPFLSRLSGLVLLVLWGTLPAAALAGEVLPGPVPAKVLPVVDGDTIVVSAHIWLGQKIETKVRLHGIDTPELRGKCPSERELAQKAKSLVEQLSASGPVVLRNIRFGKFAGRVLGQVETPEGRNFATSLIRSGLARAYEGGDGDHGASPSNRAI